MPEKDEKWTQRGDGVFTDDEGDDNRPDESSGSQSSPPAAGSFGHRLARFARQVPKTTDTENKPIGGEDKSPGGGLQLGAFARQHKNFERKTGSESHVTSTFRASISKPSTPTGLNNNNAGTKPTSEVESSIGKLMKGFGAPSEAILEAPTVSFPPPPGGFGGGSRLGSVRRGSGKLLTRQRARAPAFGRAGSTSRFAPVPRRINRRPTARKQQPSSPRQSTIVPGFPRSSQGPAALSPNVKRLCVTGNATSDVVEVSTDATLQCRSIRATHEELPALLSSYQVSQQVELSGIQFETPLASAFAQVEREFWADCEVVLHNCDFRSLSADVCATLFAQFASPRIQFKGLIVLPDECQDLLELANIKETTCLKFCCSETGQFAPSVKIDTGKLAKWMHSGRGATRYVLLQHRQISPDLDALIRAFRKEHKNTPAVSQFVLEVCTSTIPSEIRGGHAIQDVQCEGRQLLNIRYNPYNDRIVIKRYSTKLTTAKAFEEEMRVVVGESRKRMHSSSRKPISLAKAVAALERSASTRPRTVSSGKTGSESSAGSVFRASTDSQVSPQHATDKKVSGKPRGRRGGRGRYRKPSTVVRERVGLAGPTDAAFPPPSAGFAARRRRARGGRGRLRGHKRHGLASSGTDGLRLPASRHGSISKSVSKELPSTEAPASPSAPTKASSTSQTSVKHLCLIGSAVSNVLELTTDKSKDGSCIQVQYADLADVLSGFCVTEQLELKGIHFDLSVAEAFAQTEHSFGSECEITWHNCDFRALPLYVLVDLFKKLVSPRIHFKGVIELPAECKSLLELPTIAAAISLKFSCSESSQIAPSVRISARKLAKWLHCGSASPRYVMLQHKHISPDLKSLLNEFRKESQYSMEQSQFLVDVYTNSVPAEIYAGRVIQEVDLKSRQRLNIRYDLLNHRIIMKRYCPQLTVAKSFEQKMRTLARVTAISVGSLSGALSPMRLDLPEYVDINDCYRSDDSTLGGTYESHTDSSAVATPEPMPLSQFALGDDENKNRFLRCIVEYFDRVYEVVRENEQWEATAEFKESLVSLIANFEHKAGSQ